MSAFPRSYLRLSHDCEETNHLRDTGRALATLDFDGDFVTSRLVEDSHPSVRLGV